MVRGRGFEPPVAPAQGWMNTPELLSVGADFSSDIVALVNALCVSCTKLLGRHTYVRVRFWPVRDLPETPACFSCRHDFDERRFAFLPRICADPAESSVEL